MVGYIAGSKFGEDYKCSKENCKKAKKVASAVWNGIKSVGNCIVNGISSLGKKVFGQM